MRWTSLFVLVPAGIASAQSLTRVSVSSNGTQGTWDSYRPKLSADGRFVAFDSFAANLVPLDGNSTGDVFVMDRSTGLLERVSVDSSGAEGDDPYSSDQPAISADGRMVAFLSDAILVPGDTQGTTDVLVRDRASHTTVRASVDSAGNPGTGGAVSPPTYYPGISPDGHLVLFASAHTSFVSGDTNGRTDVFAHDLLTGVTERISVSTLDTQSDEDSYTSAASWDGRFVAFGSLGRLAPEDTQAWDDVYVRDRQAGTTELLSVNLLGAAGNGPSALGGISSDGRFVVFASGASDLVAVDTNGLGDIFVRDRQTGVTTLVSVSSSGEQGANNSIYGAISDDGRWVVFQSDATNLVTQPWDRFSDIFLHDCSTGTTTLLSGHADSFQIDQNSRVPAISADGSAIAFQAAADNLVPGDINESRDILVYSVPPTLPAPVSYGTGKVNIYGCPPRISWNGEPSLTSAFYITALDAVPDRLGILIYGVSGRASVPFGGGTRYVASPLKRSPASTSANITSAGVPCRGTFSINMTAFSLGLAGGHPIAALSTPGTVVDCQWWGRESPWSIQLSDAIEYTVAP